MTAHPNRINHQPSFLLTAVPWRESSLRLEVFTRDYGRIALLARSARKRQSELRGVLVQNVPFSASWYGSGELKTLHRAEWLGGWPQPQGRALLSALYAGELVLRLTAREDPHPALFDALGRVMKTVALSDGHTAALRLFEWKLLGELGFAPDLHRDGSGLPVDAAKTYRLRPEHAVEALDAALPPDGRSIAVDGATLVQLREGRFTDPAALQQALRLNRMLLDFLLPEGIASRQVLQQIQAFQTARNLSAGAV